MAGWSLRDIPSQAGRLAVITGATGGLGFETALGLAGADAEVILTGRNDAKGRDALARIRAAHPGAAIRYATLDTSSLASVAAFAERFAAEGRGLDLLVNNAGVMALPTRRLSVDGFELQFATNYLGHFALTARLLPALRRGSAVRVVNLASVVHHIGRIALDDLQGERTYQPRRAYAQSKLAMLLFTLELQRRSTVHGWHLAAIAAHPGWARTDLIAKGPGAGGALGLFWRLSQLGQPFLSHSAAAGALPTLFAATSPEAKPGAYYGPQGPMELKGPVGPAKVSSYGQEADMARKLWDVSVGLAGVGFT